MFNLWVISLSTRNWGIHFPRTLLSEQQSVCFILQVLIARKRTEDLKGQMCNSLIWEGYQDSQEEVICVTTDTGQAHTLDQS